MKIKAKIVTKLAAYFDLLSLEGAWKVDEKTPIELEGSEVVFSTKDQVTAYRERYEKALRGFVSVMRSD